MSAPEFNLDRAVEALRIEHEDSPGDDADGTRWRIRDSLESARVARGRLIAALVVCGVLSTGGVSWAYLSGRLEGVWPWLVGVVSGGRVSEEQPKPDQPNARAPRIAVAEPKTVAPEITIERQELATPRAEPAPSLAKVTELPAPPRLAAAPARTVKPRPAVKAIAPAAPADEPVTRVAPVAAATPVASAPAIAATAPAVATRTEEPALAAAPDLYRVAHQLHFHGADPSASLAAWDTYLASESSGRFAVEARYNRAMALIRLRRYHDAQLALQPFALGLVSPTGYRQREAQQLSQRLARAAASAAK